VADTVCGQDFPKLRGFTHYVIIPLSEHDHQKLSLQNQDYKKKKTAQTD